MPRKTCGLISNSHQVITAEAPVLLRVTWWSEWIRVTKLPEKWNIKWDLICKWIHGDVGDFPGVGWNSYRFFSVNHILSVFSYLAKFGVASSHRKVKAQIHPKKALEVNHNQSENASFPENLGVLLFGSWWDEIWIFFSQASPAEFLAPKTWHWGVVRSSHLALPHRCLGLPPSEHLFGALGHLTAAAGWWHPKLLTLQQHLHDT